LTKAEGRKFGLSVGLAFCALGSLVWWRGHAPVGQSLGGLGVLLVLSGAMIPDRLEPVQRAWMGLAHALSKVTTPIFMSLVYFVVISPVGFLRRTFGRNPLKHAPRDGSYWVARTSEQESSLERQF
jgi:hypothetical protein